VNKKIIVFDTTLRDGEQSPGASLNEHEKVEIAHQLARLKVDVIEAGFPISSPAQFNAVYNIAQEVNCTIAALSRASEKDIKAAADSLAPAKRKRIHTFTSTSDYHILGKFGHDRYGKSIGEKRKTILKMSYDAVAYARTFCEDVEFSAEDAGRTEIGYLSDIIEAAIDAGATTVNIPDTTGYTMPSEFGKKIADLKRRVLNINNAVISVHCHNDLGLAVANSIASIENGARQVECTINGIGERAGNASLEEIVMALKVREDILHFYTDIISEEIYNTSRMVSAFTGIMIQRNKAIVGENAFSHESGIHSGRHGLKSRLEKLGYSLEEEELNKIYESFTELADKKKEVFDDDLRVMMGDNVFQEDEFYELDYLHISSGSNSIPSAVVRIKAGEKIIEESSTGDGPVDAVFNAIERGLNISSEVESYQVRSVTSGRQALGEALIRIRSGEKSFNGRGVSTDIIEASAHAYLQALHRKKQFYEEEEKVKGTKKMYKAV
jgi:2-isopropylmalate synthase